jgi:hypothetical protein
MTRALVCASAALLLAAPASASDQTVRQTFRAGLAATHPGDFHVRARAVRQTLGKLRRDRPSSRSGQEGRRLAIGGYLWALWALRAQIEFVDEDSGQVAEATRDAARADRCWLHAAPRLRAAGEALGVPVGLVNGF